MNVQRILVPVDYSACSWEVAEKAAQLAKRLGAAVVLLHVAELPRGVTAATVVRPGERALSSGDYVRQDATARLASLLEAVRAHGVDADAVVELGPVTPTILAVADAHAADLIVMGTHGREGLARVMLGSVAEGVVHRAHVPVMLIRREPKATCAHRSCAWCANGSASVAEAQLSAELDG